MLLLQPPYPANVFSSERQSTSNAHYCCHSGQRTKVTVREGFRAFVLDFEKKFSLLVQLIKIISILFVKCYVFFFNSSYTLSIVVKLRCTLYVLRS